MVQDTTTKSDKPKRLNTVWVKKIIIFGPIFRRNIILGVIDPLISYHKYANRLKLYYYASLFHVLFHFHNTLFE